MREFFRRLNDGTGIFESVRMVHWFAPFNGLVERCLSFGFIFRDRRFFSEYQNCFMFAGNLLYQTCNGSIACDRPFLLEIQPARLISEQLDGWVMDIYVSGTGANEDAARQRLDQVLATLTPFFQNGRAR
jgi:hypothetical protein